MLKKLLKKAPKFYGKSITTEQTGVSVLPKPVFISSTDTPVCATGYWNIFAKEPNCMANILVFDPNIWISLAWKNDFSLIERVIEQDVILASSQKAMDEVENVLSRKKFSQRISSDNLQEILSLYRFATTTFDPDYTFSTSPDSKDNYLFDICRESRAAYLVTGDNALLAMQTVLFPNFHTTEIISLSHVQEILR
jgi:uncharacterized protein